jgi:DNA-3-methyladenine glycosylase II
MSMKRFRVAEHSMTPTLQPGDEVVASDARTPVPGDLVVFEHPGRPDFWMIKRLIDDTGWVMSDNLEVAGTDSRTLGRIPVGQMLRVVGDLDSETFREACALLADEDESLAGAILRWGVPEFWHRHAGFGTLVLLILEQQVSLESGAAMYRRLTRLTGQVDPGSVISAGEDALRSIGVTRQKAAYLMGLARQVVTGALDLQAVAAAPTETARGMLMAVKGIGAWTADAYLLSALRRPDVWPVGDRALQVGAGEVLGMAATPNEEELGLIGEPWRPVRAAAARLIWHTYLRGRGRAEPPDPMHAHMARPDA